MPIKTFTSAPLASTDVDTYLMNQAVITCTSSTRPSTPTNGMHIYETDTGRTLRYNGSAWENICALQQDSAPSFATYGSAITAGNTATILTTSITTGGIAVLEFEVSTNMLCTSTVAGLLELFINGTQVRSIRYHNRGVGQLLVVGGTAKLAVPAGTIACLAKVSSDNTSTGNVTPEEVNYDMREMA